MDPFCLSGRPLCPLVERAFSRIVGFSLCMWQRGMTDQPVKDRATYYLVRSAEARAKADAMSDTEAKKATMLQMAAMWELMAKCEAHYQLSQRSPGSLSQRGRATPQ